MTGILIPLLAYRFRVIFNFSANTSELKPTSIDPLLLTQHVKKVDLDLLNKQLYVEIRQSVTPEVFNSIIDILDYVKQSIIIEPMSSNNSDALWSIHFTQCKCTNYEGSFDYSISDAFYHKLTFKFHRVITLEPIDWSLYTSPSENIEVEGTITPDEAIKKYTKKKSK